MEKIRLEAKSFMTDRSGGRTSQTEKILEFEGEKIGEQYENYSLGRHLSRRLFQTKAGKYVVLEERWSQHQGEGGADEIYVFENKKELQEKFEALANSSENTEKVEFIE